MSAASASGFLLASAKKLASIQRRLLGLLHFCLEFQTYHFLFADGGEQNSRTTE